MCTLVDDALVDAVSFYLYLAVSLTLPPLCSRYGYSQSVTSSSSSPLVISASSVLLLLLLLPPPILPLSFSLCQRHSAPIKEQIY